MNGSLSSSNQMPLTPILVCEIYDIWGIEFRVHFPSSFQNLYIFLAVNYVSKWVEAEATRTDDAKAVVGFVKANIGYLQLITHKQIYTSLQKP